MWKRNNKSFQNWFAGYRTHTQCTLYTDKYTEDGEYFVTGIAVKDIPSGFRNSKTGVGVVRNPGDHPTAIRSTRWSAFYTSNCIA